MKATLLLFMLLASAHSMLADTPLTLRECEERFVRNNLQLLADRYGVAASKALAIQASIWDLPQLSLDVNAYNPGAGSVFNIGPRGQTSAAIQQLLYLGGKKSKETDLANNDVQVREARFTQLLRDLRHRLRVSFYSAAFGYRKISFLRQRVQQLDSLAASYASQTDAGNISLRESVRLQALALAIRNDLLSENNAMRDLQSDLRTLVVAEEDIVPVVSEDLMTSRLENVQTPDVERLQALAAERNAEIAALERQSRSDSLNLVWQESLNVPDLTLGASYDQRGGAFNDQINVGVSMPLPLWSKNRGNIELARAAIGQTQSLLSAKRMEINNQLRSTIAQYRTQQSAYMASRKLYTDMDTVFDGVLMNFTRRNVSMIDFTDFIESYVQSVLSIEDAKNRLIMTEETINHLTGDDVF